jgi:hypothetical protein
MKYTILLISLFFWIESGYAFFGSDKKYRKFKKGSMVIVMTVDWEGREISEKNLRAFSNFRKRYPGIPILQFLNAAYYTKPNANAKEITRKINSVLRPHDEHGLHIHAWKTLVEASGVAFRKTPDLSGSWGLRNCEWDCGHPISLDAYTADEMTKIIRKSVSILTEQGFKKPRSFRSGAWQSGKNVKTALSRTGFYLDSSETVPDFVSPSWGRNSGLVRSIVRLWPKATITQQPYLMNTKPRPVWQLPDNGSLADYTTGDQVLTVLKKNVDAFLENPKPSHWVVIGFHTETAATYLPRVEDAIEKTIKYSKKRGVPIQFSHLPLKLRQKFEK